MHKKKITAFFILLLCMAPCLGGCFDAGGKETVYLSTPSGVAFDASTHTLSWNPVEHGNEYEIRVTLDSYNHPTGELPIITKETAFTFEAGEFAGTQGTYTFAVIALGYTAGKTEYRYSAPGTAYWYRMIPPISAPTQLAFDRAIGRLSWEPVTDAEEYVVEYFRLQYAGEVFLGSERTAAAYLDFAEAITETTPLVFKVQAVTTDIDKTDSPKTQLTSYIRLSMPENLAYTLSGGTTLRVFWDVVPNATFYEISYTYSLRWPSGNGSNESRTLNPVNLAECFIFLAPGPTYRDIKIRIRACVNPSSYTYSNSDTALLTIPGSLPAS